ncbi:MAG TPA: Rieske 2Fe-2S domain-containing protein [Chloroflexota bacterium]|nr:Rieske 2Fe-2S domain-containing protein [Chloroflexota bacterium]
MENNRSLPPFPNSWFVIGFSDELRPGGLLRRRLAGQDLVVFRTESGVPGAMDAYCPHLGADFSYGGKVVGETIRCPFHGFCFNREGTCVATGYGTKPPPTAQVRTWPFSEQNGLLMVYYHGGDAAPTWEVPAFDVAGWGPPLTRCFYLKTHPQETTENGVDIGHLAWVHGYQDVEVLKSYEMDGPRLVVRYAMSRSANALGKVGQRLRAEFTISVHGLGLSVVEVDVPAFGMRTRHFVCATPVDAGRLDMRVVMRLREVSHPAKINPALTFVPRSLVNSLIARLTFNGFLHDLQQDFPMWEHKQYIQPPLLAKGDGPIGKFRTWTRQFYSQPVPMLEREPVHMEV